MTFEETGLKPEILKAIAEMGFENPTPIQEQDRKSTRLNSSHSDRSRMPSSA